MRLLGPLLVVAFLAWAGAMRWQTHTRADNLATDEARALAVVVDLQREGRERAQATRSGHPGLAALASRHPGLEPLPELSDDASVEYAADADYMYALARTTVRRDDGSTRPGWILRAWPRRFGQTGDLEYHVDQDNRFFIGQNELGRSGTDWAFPPPFPQPDLREGRNAAWWQVRLPERDGGD